MNTWRKETRDIYIPQVVCARCDKRDDVNLGKDVSVLIAKNSNELPEGVLFLSSGYRFFTNPVGWGSVQLAKNGDHLREAGGVLCGDCLAGLTTALAKIMRGSK